MSNIYLDSCEINFSGNKPDLNNGLTQSAYVSAEELHKPYPANALPTSPEDEFPNFYTDDNTDLELQGYYLAKQMTNQAIEGQEKMNNNYIDHNQATGFKNKSQENTSNSTYINDFPGAIESTNIGAPLQQMGAYEEGLQDAVNNGYGDGELNALGRAGQRKPENITNKVAEVLGDNEDLQVLNSITAFEKIINSEDDPEPKNASNESQGNIANINLFYNTEFRRLMSLPDSVKKFEQLGQLANDFVYNAETYGRIIISERTLPPESKTVKPTALGGHAGGEKFVVRGILFKYAVDTNLTYRGKPFWMYGGSTADDERASKAGGHELLGCSNIMNCNNIPDLSTPLMALIDYKGYRLVAMSFLPISKGSLVYGSSDAGKTVHNDAPPVVPLMRKVGKKLNLLDHLVGNKRIVGPGDIEVHRGEDDRFYIVDFARLFPPAKPSPETNSRAVFYEFLRPELVQSHPVPLSSDAFTSWNKLDPNVKKQEADVEAATNRLMNEVIPSFAAKLGDPETIKRINENWIGLTVLELHNDGINLRFLGRVRRQSCIANNAEAQRIIVTEMVCRALKNELRAVWRSQLNRMKLPIEQPFRKEALKILNYFADPNGHQYFWKHEIKVSLMQKYGVNSLTDQEKDNTVSLYHHLQLNALHLVKRFCELVGIDVSDRALDTLQTHQRENIANDLQTNPDLDLQLPKNERDPSDQKLNASEIFKRGIDLKLQTLKSLQKLEPNRKPSEFEFTDTTITAIKHKVKYTSFIDYATGIASLLKVLKMKDWKSSVKVDNQVSLLHHARMRFEHAISLTPNSTIYKFNLARTMLELFKRDWSSRKESVCMQIFNNTKKVLDDFPNSPVVLYDWSISGFFCAYGFSRTNAAAKDAIGQQARNALTKALKQAPELTSKVIMHMDSWAWMLRNQFDSLMSHNPSYASTHGLWDELHNLVVIGLQLASTALAANFNKDLAMTSIRFALHAMVYLHCLTDLRFGLEKTMATVTYYLYTKKQRSLFNLCVKHVWDTMRRIQKSDPVLDPVFVEIQELYKEWQKIVAKPKLLKSDVSIMKAYTSSSRHLSNFDFHFNRLYYLSAIFQSVVTHELRDEVQIIPLDTSYAFELSGPDPQDSEKDYEDFNDFIKGWMTYEYDWSTNPRLTEKEEEFFLRTIKPMMVFNAADLPFYPKMREYILLWGNIYVDFCYMQWSASFTDRGLKLIEHLNAKFPDFSCQHLKRQLHELEPFIVAQKDLFFYWKGAQIFHLLHQLKKSGFYDDRDEYLHFFWLIFDNAIFMKEVINVHDDGEEEDPYCDEATCIQDLVKDLLTQHPEQAEQLLTRVKTMLDMILQNTPVAKQALASNAFSLQIAIIITVCICIYDAKNIAPNTRASALWLMHQFLTKSPFKAKIASQLDTYDICKYDAAALKTEALTKCPNVASDPRWLIPSQLTAVKFDTITPNTYNGTGFKYELDDDPDDEEEMIDDLKAHSAHQIRKRPLDTRSSKK